MDWLAYSRGWKAILPSYKKKEKKNKFCVVIVYLNSIFGLLLLAKKDSGLFIYFLSSWTFGLCKLNFQGFWFFFFNCLV